MSAICCFGEIMLRLSPPAGERLVRARGFDAVYGGAEANVAAALSVSKRKAYDIIYSLPHLSGPIRVSEKVLEQWIKDSTIYPVFPGKNKRGKEA